MSDTVICASVDAPSDEKSRELSFWAQLAPLYSRPQIRLMKSLARDDRKRGGIWIGQLLPQWFLGAPVLKGFAIPAPAMGPVARSRMLALYHFARSGNA